MSRAEAAWSHVRKQDFSVLEQLASGQNLPHSGQNSADLVLDSVERAARVMAILNLPLNTFSQQEGKEEKEGGEEGKHSKQEGKHTDNMGNKGNRGAGRVSDLEHLSPHGLRALLCVRDSAEIKDLLEGWVHKRAGARTSFAKEEMCGISSDVRSLGRKVLLSRGLEVSVR